MLVANSGGPEGVLRAMISQNRKACCCCPSDPFRLYKRVQLAVFQFLVLRPIVVITGAVFLYLDINILFLMCKTLTVLMFVFGFGSLAIFCEFSLLSMSATALHCIDLCVCVRRKRDEGQREYQWNLQDLAH